MPENFLSGIVAVVNFHPIVICGVKGHSNLLKLLGTEMREAGCTMAVLHYFYQEKKSEILDCLHHTEVTVESGIAKRHLERVRKKEGNILERKKFR
jgi:hypothetical protein